MSETEDNQEAFWARAEAVFPGCSSDRYAVRVDQDLYLWFRDQGPDYELKINEILRRYKESQEA